MKQLFLFCLLAFLILVSGCVSQRLQKVDPEEICKIDGELLCESKGELPDSWDVQKYKTFDGINVSCRQILSCNTCEECFRN